MQRKHELKEDVNSFINNAPDNDDNSIFDTNVLATTSVPFAIREFNSNEEYAKNKHLTKGYNITFTDCTFQNNVIMLSDNNKECVITFVNCIFIKDVNGEDAVMDGKVRFRNCTFKGKVNFRNTTFNNLLDFWRSTFELNTIFYKTDFLDIVVLSAVTFKKNVLFTYSLINKLLILRGTKAEQGFDLSLAILSGNLSVFDFHLKNFKTYNAHNEAIKELAKDHSKNYLEWYEFVYESAVSNIGEIPINNKRETYRILKKHHESQSNIVESIPYAVLEKRTFFEESWKNLISFNNKKSKTNAFSNLWVLSWNAISNWFNSYYILGAFFTLSIAILFFNLSILYTPKVDFAFNFNAISNGIKDFLTFFNPVHKFDYLDKDILKSKLTSPWFYIFDFIGRLFVGYGIYQTVQAFRKFR